MVALGLLVSCSLGLSLALGHMEAGKFEPGTSSFKHKPSAEPVDRYASH